MIARRWEHLEPMAALCRLQDIPVRLLRDEQLPDLHATREGYQLLSLLKAKHRQAKRSRALLRVTVLSRWFRRRFRLKVGDVIKHPYRAALAQFIQECESVAPGAERVVTNLVDALYEFGSGTNSLQDAQASSSMLLLTAHRAKGLEFDHVLILDSGGWTAKDDEERRLFYVAMTRARKTLSLCERQGKNHHAFVRDCEGLSLLSHPVVLPSGHSLSHRSWVADPKQVVLSWPSYFTSQSPIHRAIASLDYGSELRLRPRSDGSEGWEIANQEGLTVTRMAKLFTPPPGEIISVRVAAILVRQATDKDFGTIKCTNWEIVLPEIVYLPNAGI